MESFGSGDPRLMNKVTAAAIVADADDMKRLAQLRLVFARPRYVAQFMNAVGELFNKRKEAQIISTDNPHRDRQSWRGNTRHT